MSILYRPTPRYLITPKYTAVLSLLFFSYSHTVEARGCNYYKEQAEHYEQMQRAGGTARQMNRWRIKNDEMEAQHHSCLNNPETNPNIQVASAEKKTSRNTPRKPKIKQMPLRNSNTNDPLLENLTKTCNYWIGVANEHSSQENISFRDSACTAADKREQELIKPFQTTAQLPARKLKDCIKPNNVVDNEVNDCVMGKLEPAWKR